MGYRFALIGVVFLVIAAGALLFFGRLLGTPPRELFPTPTATTTQPQATTTEATSTEASSSAPLSARVRITSPKSGTSVSHSFDVTGQVPGSWSFEAQFPIQVRDPQDNVIGQATAHVQGDWMTDALVSFAATVQIDSSYHGHAMLILLKDNPSGLPEQDDASAIPIEVQ